MIITIVIIVIDWIVLTMNTVPLLPWHCFYLIYLTVVLRFSKQPKNYSLSVQEASQLLTMTEQNNPQTIVECRICRKAKPPRYYHCRHCQKCIYRLDHHCDFINNCVGQYNFKVYVHFLINGFIHSCIVSIYMLWNWRSLVGLEEWMGLFWFVVLPAFFGIYETGRLLSAFKTTVERNQTLIESYKIVRGPKRSQADVFEEYFGKKQVEWFIPKFVQSQSCSLLEPTFALQRSQNIKEYTYADEYLYGADDEDETNTKND